MIPLAPARIDEISHVIQLAVAPVFLLAMLSLIACLATFLREIFISVRSARETMRRRVDAAGA